MGGRYGRTIEYWRTPQIREDPMGGPYGRTPWIWEDFMGGPYGRTPQIWEDPTGGPCGTEGPHGRTL